LDRYHIFLGFSEGFQTQNEPEMSYDQRCHSEAVRLTKNSKVLGMAMDPLSESRLGNTTVAMLGYFEFNLLLNCSVDFNKWKNNFP